MRYNLLIALVLSLFLIAGLIVFNFKTANVVVEYQEVFAQGDQLTGKLTIGLEPGDSLNKDTPILISLSKGNNILQSETLRLEEFIQLSDTPLEPNGEVYEVPGSYSVDVSKIITHKFTEKGDYELLFSVLKIDLAVKKSITVQ